MSARADLFTYDNFAAFSTAIAGRPLSTLNFDSSADNTNVKEPPGSFFQGVRFDPNNSVTGRMIVTNGNPAFSPGLKTFSGLNYLGSDAGEVIKQSFVIQFQVPVTSVGLYIISPSNLGSGEAGITVGNTNSLINLATQIDLSPTAGNLVPTFAYFIGIAESNPALSFSSVTINPDISTITGGVGIDNLSFTAVPEPGSMLALSLSLFFAMFVQRKRVLAYTIQACSLRS